MQTKMVVFDMAGTTVEDSDNVHQSLMNAMKTKAYDVTRDDVNRVMGYPEAYSDRDATGGELWSQARSRKKRADRENT
jgi:beta-phosphoglucomutase-like phosphatase (HAD superfamily)